MADIPQVTDGTFEQEVLQSDVPALVDFWAVWCAPCHMVTPIMEELAKDYQGRLKVFKLDVDNNPATAAKYGIFSIPSILLFKDGKVATQIIGAMPKKHFVERLQALL
jgi:thioredoxin 1